MKRSLPYIGILISVLALQSCNIAKILNGTGLTKINATAPLQTYSLTKAANKALSSTVSSEIQGTDIYVTLPYSIVNDNTPLTPAVKLAPGYSITPSGSYVLKDGMTLNLTKQGTSQSTKYTLHVSVTPGTAPPPPPTSAISSFELKTSNNPDLSTNANAVIIGTNLYLSLPYAVVSGKTPLTPTITMNPGFTISSPTGTYPIINGMTLAVVQTSSGQKYNYVIHLSAQPSAQYAGGSSLVQSFVVTSAQNPSLKSDSTAIISGSNIYISLPLNDVTNGVKITPTVTLAPGYTITPNGSYAMSDGMKLTITQTSTAAITNYTLHVGTNAASMAFFNLAAPFYYDSGGNKISLSSSQYQLQYNTTNSTYTLTLNTDAFPSFAPYYATDTQAILGQNIGFGTVNTPYNATVTGANSAIAGAATPYTVTVKSSDGTVDNTFTIDATRTKSSYIGVSGASANATYVYNYTDTPSWTSSYSAWLGQGAVDGATNNTAYLAGGTTSTGCSETVQNGTTWGSETIYHFAPSGSNQANINGALGNSDSGKLTSGSTSANLGTNPTITLSASYGNLGNSSDGTRTGTFSVSTTVTADYYKAKKPAGGAACSNIHSYTSPNSVSTNTYSTTPSLTVALTRSYSPAGYIAPTRFTVDIPKGISIVSVTKIADVASTSSTVSGNNNVVTINMGATTSKLVGALAGIVAQAESGAEQTIYVTGK